MVSFLDMVKTVILGVIEGVTEWLPISSTGHLILVEDFLKLGVSDGFWYMFEVVIQLGAILAVVFLFWSRLWPVAYRRRTDGGNCLLPLGALCLKKDTTLLWVKILIAMLPAAIIGIPLDDWMEEHLHNSPVVAAALIVYGILFILVEKRNAGRTFAVNSPEEISYKTALGIGFAQALSLVPGTSRSGSTILGASFLGVSRTAAAEFSFFLAVPVMLGASLLKGAKYALSVLSGAEVFGAGEALILTVGAAVAFVVSLGAIRFLMSFVKKHGFTAFGVYRIVLGVIVLFVYFIGK
ncbi:MAG: undecaprenyl-diphosphate phosphatase [Clostridia bacterium]|nr:undecaprenyl-diphosphate phosphatase [Clostridia bacterium]